MEPLEPLELVLVVFGEICVVIVVFGSVVLGRPIGRPIFFDFGIELLKRNRK